MMGRQTTDQARLFYAFNLEDRVPQDHLLRRINVFMTGVLHDLHSKLTPFYSSTGRPSIDPELMVRMLVVGYCLGIRSERRLCEDVGLNLAYRWFCRLDLDDPVPDHSTFSKNRHGRFRDSHILRHVFERVVDACIGAGLVGGEGFAVDASLIEADANKQRSLPSAEWRNKDHCESTRRSVQDYLATLDDAAFGAASAVPPKFVSPSDPAAQWTGAHKGPAFFAYATNYLIDTDNAVIVDVEASRAIRQAEVGAAKTMIERTEKRFFLRPDHLAADTAYGSAENLHWLIDGKKIIPHIPVIDKFERGDGSFSREHFAYDTEHDIYICPADKALRTTGTRVNDGDTLLYRAAKADCDTCPLKPRCCPKSPVRKIPRSIYETSRDVARSLADTAAFKKSRHDRKRVEMLFAHLKRILKLGRLRLRGPTGAKDEFLLAATAQNLRKLAAHIKPTQLSAAT